MTIAAANERSSFDRLGGSTLAALGIAQLTLICLAFGRVLNPSWPVIDATGTVAGLGMAAACGSVAMSHNPRHLAVFRLFSMCGIAAGLVYAWLWLSLQGGTFWTNDLPRTWALVGVDVVIAVWVAAAAFLLSRPRPPALAVLARFLAIRALGEFAVLNLWTTRPPGAPTGASDSIQGLYIAGLVLSGIVVLAIWEVALGRRLVRSEA